MQRTEDGILEEEDKFGELRGGRRYMRLLHIIFFIPMTINDVNLSVAFRGVSGPSS
jgi:hypothetical protein